MPSPRHEALVELIRTHPAVLLELLAPLLAQLGVPGAEGVLVPLDPTAREIRPVEVRADAVFVLHGPRPLNLVLEVQLRPDARKRRVWPLYQSSVFASNGYPTLLVVLTPNTRVARWASQPIVVGPGQVVTPVVLGPQSIPARIHPARALQHPELVVVAAQVHGHGPQATRLGVLALQAFRELDTGQRRLYLDLVFTALAPVARARMEAIMRRTKAWRPQSEFFLRYWEEAEARGIEKGIEKGREEGRRGQVRLLEDLLQERFGRLPPWARERLAAASPDELQRWAPRILHVDGVEQVFAT